MGGRGIRSLKARVGRECCISRRDARLNSRGVQAGGVPGGSHNVVRCGIFRRNRGAASGVAPGVRAAKSFECKE